MTSIKAFTQILITLGLFAASATHAQTPSTQTNGLLEDSEKVQQGLIWLGGHIDTLTHRIDNFFAPEQHVDAGKAQLKLSLNQTQSKHYPADTKVQLNIYARLPRIEERFNLYIETFSSREEQEQDTQKQAASKPSEDQFIGLASVFSVSDHTSWKNRVGSRMNSGKFDPYITSHLRFENKVDQNWFVNLEPGVFWQKVEGAGQDIQLNLAHRYTEKDFLRLSSQAVKYNRKEYYELQQSFEWLHRFSDRNRLSYQLGRRWHWEQTEQFTIQDSYAQINWRHRLYKHWLFLSITPGVHEPIDLGYQTNPYLHIGLEAFSRDTQL
ncbi:hypothetical protein [Thiomicrospira microaerophila]|uniref:hypothetical protein n=1 Tax=Thiomicrospira microaerophila TaxID=406020 RepID=UPI0005C97ED5|nr:hypothetical protein [Thiomicrospira microaerophila]